MNDDTPLVPSLYPRTYGMRAAYKIRHLMLVLVGMYLLVLFLRSTMGSITMVWIACVVPGFVALTFLNFSFSKVTLYSEHVEISRWFGKRKIQRREIVGAKVVGGFHTPVLVLKDDDTDCPALPKHISEDAAWRTWMAGIPDINAVEEKKLIDDAIDNPQLGAGTEEREHNLKRAYVLSRWLKWAAIIGCISTIVPLVYASVSYVLIILPWLALGHMYLYGVTLTYELRRNPVSNNILALILPGIVLCLFGTQIGPEIVPSARFFSQGFIWSIPLMAATVLCLRSQPWLFLCILLPGIVFAQSLYGPGLLYKLNVALDHSAGTPYTATVLEKKPYDGRGRPQLALSQWGNEPDRNTIGVSHDIYNAVEPSHSLCLALHPGTFGIAWFTVKTGQCDQ